MSEISKPVFESNGLLDFFPTPPHSTEDESVQTHSRPSDFTKDQNEPPRTKRIQYDDDAPPPDFDEEPSDFEDEVMGIMEREKESSGRPAYLSMDIDEEEEPPVASCTSGL
jgi:hypothetical protein